jgi:putative oxidoreductase
MGDWSRLNPKSQGFLVANVAARPIECRKAVLRAEPGQLKEPLMLRWIWATTIRTNAPRATFLVRLLVGLVFLSEGIQKFVFPASLGPGRFETIGLPMPEVLAYFVGCVETACGSLLVLGLLTRPAALILAVNISVAILSTKIPILLGHEFWGFHLKEMSRYGFWAMAHESRTDFCMWLGSLFLLIVGGGRWSVDMMAARRQTRPG